MSSPTCCSEGVVCLTSSQDDYYTGHEPCASARRLQALETYGGPLLGIPRGTAGAGETSTTYRGGALRRFYTKQHQCYCGIDRHARPMDVCLLDHPGEIGVQRNMQAQPDALLKTIAPSRDKIVIAVECVFTWDWLVALWDREGLPFVLGHALDMQAIHGGKAKHDTTDAQKLEGLLRGGLLPPAYVYPAPMRATRDLLRRRTHVMRKPAAWLAHSHNTNRQYTPPEMGKKLADRAHRDGVAERFADPAVHKSIAVDRALLGPYDHRLRDMALSILKTAKPHNAQPLYLLRPVPGIGERLSLVWLDEIHAIARIPRVHDYLS